METNSVRSSRLTGRPCTRAASGSKLANTSPRIHHSDRARITAPAPTTATRSNVRTRTAEPKRMESISCASWEMRSPSSTAAPPVSAQTRPSSDSRGSLMVRPESTDMVRVASRASAAAPTSGSRCMPRWMSR
jgi:hypothetical protein